MAYYNAPRPSYWGVIAYPTVEPVTLEEAMDHLNIDLDDRHNDNILRLIQIPTARQYCEGYRGQTLAPQTLEIGYGGYAPPTTVPEYWQPPMLNPWAADSHYIALPYGPVSEVVSVIYRDAAGDEQTMDPADYVLVGDLLLLATGASWPAVAASANAIAIRYIAGYTLPEDALPYPLPPLLRSAMLLMLGHLFDNRSAVEAGKLETIPLGAQALMDMCPGKLRLGMA